MYRAISLSFRLGQGGEGSLQGFLAGVLFSDIFDPPDEPAVLIQTVAEFSPVIVGVVIVVLSFVGIDYKVLPLSHSSHRTSRISAVWICPFNRACSSDEALRSWI